MNGKALLLDVGNTRLKWAWLAGRELEPGGVVAHGGDPAAAFAAQPWPAAVGRVCIADVTGGTLRTALAVAVSAATGVAPQFARPRTSFAGLTCAYDEPERLGVDRWLMLLAAWTATRGAASVVSAGTALTFDAVDNGGRHLGGVIAPGLHAMQSAVLGATRFPASSPAHGYHTGLGRDTDGCVRQGALHAAVGLIERLDRAVPTGPRWICGGDAAALLPHLGDAWTLRPDLVLEGLAALARADAAA